MSMRSGLGRSALSVFTLRPKGTEVQILTVVHSSIPLFLDPTLLVAAAHMEQTLELRRDAPALVEAASKIIRDADSGIRVTTKIIRR